MALSTLVVDLILKAGGFESDFGRASKTAQKRMKEIEAGAKKMGVAIGAALAAGVTGLGLAVKSAIDRADELYNTAQKIGVTTEALSGLEYAAKQSGVELDALQGSLAKMVRIQAEAAQGNDKAKATYDAFGISIRDASGHLRDSESVLMDWADIFRTLPDGAEKSALAMRVFGKSGADLIPFLNEGRGGIRKLLQEAERLGLVISTQTGKQADEFNDSLDRLKGTLGGVAMEIARDVLPKLQSMANDMQEATQKGNAASSIATVLGAIGTAASITAEHMRVLTSMVLGVFNAASSLSKVTLPGWIANMIQDGDSAGEDWRQATSAMGQVTDSIRRVIGGGAPARAPVVARSDSHAFRGSAARGRREGAAEAAAAKLLAQEQDKGTSSSKAATEAKRAAAEAARAQAEREEQLREALKKVADASSEFRIQLEDLAAERAGPQAEAQLAYERSLKSLRELAATGEVSTTDLARAENLLAEQLAETNAEIEKRLNPAKQVLQDLQFQIDLTRMLTDEERDRAIFLKENINATTEQAEAYVRMQAELEETRQATAALDEARRSIADLFVDLAENGIDALDNFAKHIQHLILQRLGEKLAESILGPMGTPGAAGGSASGGILSFFTSLFGSAKGNVFQNGMALTAFAHGGVVDRPSVFPMAHGMGLMAEAGPEAIMPLARDAQGRLGVRGGGSSSGFKQTINYNVQGRVDRRTRMQMSIDTARDTRRALARNRV